MIELDRLFLSLDRFMIDLAYHLNSHDSNHKPPFETRTGGLIFHLLGTISFSTEFSTVKLG